MKTIYHVEFTIFSNSYSLCAYDLKKETDKRYYVKDGKTIIGGGGYRSFLDKDDKHVYTDFELAQAAIVAVIENFIQRNQFRITTMQNNIEFVKKLHEENWRDIMNVKVWEDV